MTTVAPELRLADTQGRWVVAATVLGSSVAMLTGTVVNVALPALGRDLDAGVADLQWILNGYLLTLAALILVGGSLGDRFGRRRIYLIGVTWYAAASLLCAVAPTAPLLIAGRVIQGIGSAMLTPGSLAIIQSSFCREDRSTAIGLWSGTTGIAIAIGPLVGGWLIDGLGWRWIFILPIPLAAAVIWASLRHVPETSNPEADNTLDLVGSGLAVLALGGLTYPMVQVPQSGWTLPVIAIGLVGAVSAVGFALWERSSAHPMVPTDIFSSRQFSAANLVTFAVYAALGGVFFMLIVHLQVVVGYSALAAGAAPIPIMALMLAGSPASGRLAQRIGPRIPLTVGPALLALGMLLMTRIEAGSGYWTVIFPAMVVFGIGLTITVAPVTATVLAAAADRYSGVASGINNAVSRTAQLIAVAALPALAGLAGDDYRDPELFGSAFRVAMLISAGLSAAGAVLAWTMIRSDVLDDEPVDVEHFRHCGVDAAPEVVRAAAD